MFLSAASFLLVMAASPARASESARPSFGQEAVVQFDAVTLSPAEQAEIHKGRIISREVPTPGSKGRTFEAVGVIAGTLDEVLGIITDYRRYHEFMPRVERTVVTDESDAESLVEQHLKLPLGVRKRYRLRYTLRRGLDGFRVDWLKVAWPEVPLSQSVVDTSGYWQVTSFGEGRLLAVYRVYTDPGRVPLGMKGLALSLSKREVPKVIERVRDKLASLSGLRDPVE
jgi:hypothetical protein